MQQKDGSGLELTQETGGYPAGRIRTPVQSSGRVSRDLQTQFPGDPEHAWVGQANGRPEIERHPPGHGLDLALSLNQVGAQSPRRKQVGPVAVALRMILHLMAFRHQTPPQIRILRDTAADAEESGTNAPLSQKRQQLRGCLRVRSIIKREGNNFSIGADAPKAPAKHLPPRERHAQSDAQAGESEDQAKQEPAHRARGNERNQRGGEDRAANNLLKSSQAHTQHIPLTPLGESV